MKKSAPRSVSCAQVAERFPDLIVEVIGDAGRVVTGTTCMDSAKPSSMVFVSAPRYITPALSSGAHVLVVSKKLISQVQDAQKNASSQTLLVSTNVELSLAMITNEYFQETPYKNKAHDAIHKTAVIGEDKIFGAGVSIGAHAVIGDRVKLGDNVFIGANAVIEDDCEIGENTVIHPLAYIGQATLIGRRCEVHSQTAIGKEGFKYVHSSKGEHYRVPHQGRVVLEDDVHVGAVCAIDRGTFSETRIGAGTKIDNSVHIAHNCLIGVNGLITAGFIVAGSTKIGAHFVAGGNSVVTGHIEITDHVHLAGLSGVSKSVLKPGGYGGYPLQPITDFLRTKAAVVQLSTMRAQFRKIMKHLDLTDEAAAAETVVEG